MIGAIEANRSGGDLDTLVPPRRSREDTGMEKDSPTGGFRGLGCAARLEDSNSIPEDHVDRSG